MFDLDAGGGKGRAKPQKIIHEPCDDECAAICVTMMKMGINGSDRVLLMFGRQVFDAPWISDTTKSWLTTLDHDYKAHEDTNDPLESQLFVAMVELDYMMLGRHLREDAQREMKKQKEQICVER